MSPLWVRSAVVWFLLVFLGTAPFLTTGAEPALDDGWRTPPPSARLRAYWWWLNGNVTRNAITRDLEEMKDRGFGGALLCDAGGAEQDGNDRVPHGPDFLSIDWRGLYIHTLLEAKRLGLELSLNIQSGWNLGGPMVTAEDAAKKLVWTETETAGPARFNGTLPKPRFRDDFYRDLFVVAFRVSSNSVARRVPLLNWEQKGMHKALHFSAPDTAPLFQEHPPTPGEEDTRAADVVDLSDRLSPEGTLRWDVPAGRWIVLRFGCTVGDHARVSTSSEGWTGFALDVLDANALNRYWDRVVGPLIAHAAEVAPGTLKYLHTDSWEVEAINWTPTLREEFRKRRGYDFLPYLPALVGRVVDSRPVSNRFLNDYRKTLGDLAIDHHYRVFRDRAHQRGLEIHPESGGPHAVPIDAQRCLGMNDVPMSEFWAWSWRHRIGESNRFFVKQPASAAHVYGHRLVAAEGFTTIGPHWQETLWDNLKPTFDRAICEGFNLLFWHAMVCSPEEHGIPGIQYFAGTHFNPNTTWWSRSEPFLAYINRCQFLAQQGRFVADAAYYYGDHVPNFAQLKASDPAAVLPGYDYDVVTEDAILTRFNVQNGRLALPDGLAYRVLVLPDRPGLSLPVLRKLAEFVEAGATVIGPKPAHPTSLEGYPAADAEFAALANRVWGPTTPAPHESGQHTLGKGRVFWGRTARQVLIEDGVPPDFEVALAAFDPTPDGSGLHTGGPVASAGDAPVFDYLHRHTDAADLYFVANRSNAWAQIRCTLRVAGKQPEVWDPVSAAVRPASSWSQLEGRTTLPLELPPFGAVWIVLRQPGTPPQTHPPSNLFPDPPVPIHELTGAWTVRFDPRWGGPATTEFPTLASWTENTEDGIRYYSGTATYLKTFDLPQALPPQAKVYLDLGAVRQLAEVRLNDQPLGIVWAVPFRVDVSQALRPAGNRLEIDVVNFWPNRIIGDQRLPENQRFTRTNIRKLTRESPLMESGLLGPVRLLTTKEPPAAR
ncbi:MAG TPA: glycosyl hydrolase [Verrucomicrobiota bacterium]|nr:glycosyl hydrolase [Verrucomicrobiota bacterium]HNU52854.1 glycosyl hydrolase [Verrucomicrobiota bacterium]